MISVHTHNKLVWLVSAGKDHSLSCVRRHGNSKCHDKTVMIPGWNNLQKVNFKLGSIHSTPPHVDICHFI